jgi:hypothetical protein
MLLHGWCCPLTLLAANEQPTVMLVWHPNRVEPSLR